MPERVDWSTIKELFKLSDNIEWIEEKLASYNYNHIDSLIGKERESLRKEMKKVRERLVVVINESLTSYANIKILKKEVDKQ